jgi:hypothetical protein
MRKKKTTAAPSGNNSYMVVLLLEETGRDRKGNTQDGQHPVTIDPEEHFWVVRGALIDCSAGEPRASV